MRATLVLLAAAVLATGCSGDEPRRPRAAPSNRIVYTLTDDLGATSVVTVDVQPPYRARTVVRRDGAVLSETAWSDGATYLVKDGQVLQSAVIAPGFPGPAAHLDVALPVAAEQGLVRDLGDEREVAGLTCHVWRSLEPLDGSDFAPAAGRSRTDTCVSETGQILDDAWYIDGELVQRRTATEVTSGPTLTGSGLFGGRTPVPLAPAERTATVTRSDVATLSALLQLPEPVAPPGLRLDTASALLDLDAERQVRRESAVLTYVGGGHLLVLRLARELQPGGASTVHGAKVRLGERTGRLLPVLAGLQLTVPGPRALTATVTTDLPRVSLLSWATSLDLGG
ncbi:MAG TPA: hypothetical protein VFJ98_06235 [Mycobacteriales bacterium]|nr:hypothetical protein [Mycobacteriales bacterium]